MSDTITLTMPKNVALLLLKLVRLAKKVHKINVDLIDIKEQLHEADPELVEQLERELSDMIL